MGGTYSTKSKHKTWPQFFDLDEKANTPEPVKTVVTGRFPSWVEGSLYRNGPGVYKFGDEEFRHLFDGMAVIHRFSIKGGQVTYRSSILDSDHYKKCVHYDRLVGDSFASTFPDPCKSLLERFFSYFVPTDMTDNCTVNVVEHGDKLFALTETKMVHQVDGDKMKSQKKLDLDEIISVHMGTAHPHFDPEGNMYYYATNVKDYTKTYNFIKVPPAAEGETPFAKGEIIATMPSRWKLHYGYVHSFGMTENYIVHFEQPIAFSVPMLIAKGLTGHSYMDCSHPYTEEGINIVLANRHTGELVPITYSAPYGFIFHFVNCYEEEGQVVADIFLWKENDPFGSLTMDALIDQLNDPDDDLQIMFARYIIPLDVSRAKPGENLVTLPDSQAKAVLKTEGSNIVDITPDFVFDEPERYYGELPRINYDYNTKKYRYCYCCTAITNVTGKLFKFDLEAKKVTEWVAGDDYCAGEPVFLKNPSGTAEDDGVILSPILAKTTEHSSFLLCLDASTFKELGRATVPKEVKINVTFHGDFYKRFN